jgi:hypothetical protein
VVGRQSGHFDPFLETSGLPVIRPKSCRNSVLSKGIVTSGSTPATFRLQHTRQHAHHLPDRLAQLEDPGLDAPGGHSHLPKLLCLCRDVLSIRALLPTAGGRCRSNCGQSGYPFRIDHDERYNQTTHLQYQIKTHGPWLGFNWRYDSGLVAGNAPCYGLASLDPNTPCGTTSTTLNGLPAIKMVNAFGIPLTADQEFQAGFQCNGVRATPTNALPDGALGQLRTRLWLSKCPGHGGVVLRRAFLRFRSDRGGLHLIWQFGDSCLQRKDPVC